MGAVEEDRDPPETHTDFSNGEAQNRWHGLFASMSHEGCWKARTTELYKVFSITAVLNDQTTERKETASIKTVLTLYSEIIAGMTRDIAERDWERERGRQPGKT